MLHRKQKAAHDQRATLVVVKSCHNVVSAGLSIGDTFKSKCIRYFNDNGGLDVTHDEHCFYVYGASEHNIPQDAVAIADFLEALPLVGVKV
jgi:hypothetical protein